LVDRYGDLSGAMCQCRNILNGQESITGYGCPTIPLTPTSSIRADPGHCIRTRTHGPTDKRAVEATSVYRDLP
jgi:hypothetical protein